MAVGDVLRCIRSVTKHAKKKGFFRESISKTGAVALVSTFDLKHSIKISIYLFLVFRRRKRVYCSAGDAGSVKDELCTYGGY